MKLGSVFSFGLLALLSCSLAFAEEPSLLADTNGDGSVRVASFGDSITYGIGDGTSPGDDPDLSAGSDGSGGYTPRLSTLLGVPVLNGGESGEELTLDGVARFPSFSATSNADLLLLLEGANDAYRGIPASEYAASLQKVINVAVAQGRSLALLTLPRPTADHSAGASLSIAYSDAVRRAGISNELRVIDIEQAWLTTCENPGRCELYMLPEGLHPNSRGYDVMAQTVAAGILGIDIFAKDGAAILESTLGLPAGTVIVKPLVAE